MKPIYTFLFFSFVLSWSLMAYVISLGGMKGSGFWVLGIMWVPGIVSLLVRKFFKMGFHDIGLQWGAWRFHALAFLVPLIVATLSYSTEWIAGINSLMSYDEILLSTKGAGISKYFLTTFPIIFLVGFLAALGEEIGWRGFLIPKLETLGRNKALLWSALIWAVWHYPLVLWGGYASSDMPVISVILFTTSVLLAGGFIGWLRFESGSVWVATVFHAAHNFFLQSAFEAFNKPGPLNQYLGGETGLIPCLAYALVLLVFFKGLKGRYL